jgi:hypothetical protein
MENAMTKVIEDKNQEPEADASPQLTQLLSGALYDLEYAAFNLCETRKEEELDERIVESTCPEASLLLAIRKIKSAIKEAT